MDSFFSTELYKRSQGRVVRQATGVTVFVILMGLVYSIFLFLQGFNFWITSEMVFGMKASSFIEALRNIIPLLMVVIFGWFSFRLVHMHRFADFLIHVEAEMRKVSWPNKPELVRSVGVVIFVMFFLAIVLFCYDLGIKALFEAIGAGMKYLFVKMGFFAG